MSSTLAGLSIPTARPSPSLVAETQVLPSLTIENYVKAIYSLSVDGAAATTGKVAEALDVSPGTVTSMLKTLQASELVDYTPYEGVLLTEAGKALALRVLRRHRLIELFLVQTLDLAWDEVHEEAENMEHAVSDLLVDRIDHYLGYPDADPHGDPIPRSDGSMRNRDDIPLANLEPGESFRIVRVMDQTTDFLKYLTDQGIGLDRIGRLENKVPSAGIVTIRLGNQTTVLATESAAKLMIVREAV